MPEPDPLGELLAAIDLDALEQARRRLPRLGEVEDERLARLLERWDDAQALANVLMHPDVVPEPLRLPALLRALRDPDRPYLSLAASVGLQRLADDPVQDDPGDDPHVQAEVVTALAQLVERSTGAVASRAALALHLWRSPADRGPLPPLDLVPSLTAWSG